MGLPVNIITAFKNKNTYALYIRRRDIQAEDVNTMIDGKSLLLIAIGLPPTPDHPKNIPKRVFIKHLLHLEATVTPECKAAAALPENASVRNLILPESLLVTQPIVHVAPVRQILSNVSNRDHSPYTLSALGKTHAMLQGKNRTLVEENKKLKEKINTNLQSVPPQMQSLEKVSELPTELGNDQSLTRKISALIEENAKIQAQNEQLKETIEKREAAELLVSFKRPRYS